MGRALPSFFISLVSLCAFGIFGGRELGSWRTLCILCSFGLVTLCELEMCGLGPGMDLGRGGLEMMLTSRSRGTFSFTMSLGAFFLGFSSETGIEVGVGALEPLGVGPRMTGVVGLTKGEEGLCSGLGVEDLTIGLGWEELGFMPKLDGLDAETGVEDLKPELELAGGLTGGPEVAAGDETLIDFGLWEFEKLSLRPVELPDLWRWGGATW